MRNCESENDSMHHSFFILILVPIPDKLLMNRNHNSLGIGIDTWESRTRKHSSSMCQETETWLLGTWSVLRLDNVSFLGIQVKAKGGTNLVGRRMWWMWLNEFRMLLPSTWYIYNTYVVHDINYLHIWQHFMVERRSIDHPIIIAWNSAK